MGLVELGWNANCNVNLFGTCRNNGINFLQMLPYSEIHAEVQWAEPHFCNVDLQML